MQFCTLRLFLFLCARKVIREAINYERNTMVYYESLKHFAPAPVGTNKIDKIVDEEKGHIDTLTKML